MGTSRCISTTQKHITHLYDLHKVLVVLFIFFCITSFSQKTSVYFRFNKYALDPKTTHILDSLIKIKSVQKIFLQGHCDSLGSHDYNDVLSNKRVTEVKKYLVAANVPENIIEIKALGKRVSLNKNETEKERALNRRVEIELLLNAPPPVAKTDSLKIPSKTPLKANQVEVVISGIVLDENKQPLVAEVALNDKNGNEIQTFTSDKDGKYQLKTILNKKEDYSLTFYNDSSFVSTKRINASNARLPYKNLNTVLPKLKGGDKYILENLNFEGDTSQLVAASLPSLEALYKLLKKNKSLVIRIEGHVNYPHYWPDPNRSYPNSQRYVPPGMNHKEFNQWLSEDRARAVYDYLIKKGIKAERLSTIGFGAGKMLFPDAYSEYEQAQNRRVEINVISVK